MILEIADFRVAADATSDFELAMEELKGVIAASPGYHGHTVQRSHETPTRYILIVRWETIEAHTQGFRTSALFETWRTRLGAHRNGAVVEHFQTVLAHEWD
jgi:heme-degrading monooxygenase HmoA